MPHPPAVSILYGSSGWKARMATAIQSGNYVRIRVKGAAAAQARLKIEAFTVVKVPAPPAPFIPVPYPAISASSFLMGMPELLSLVLQALTTRGYSSVRAGFDPKASGGADDELILDIS